MAKHRAEYKDPCDLENAANQLAASVQGKLPTKDAETDLDDLDGIPAPYRTMIEAVATEIAAGVFFKVYKAVKRFLIGQLRNDSSIKVDSQLEGLAKLGHSYAAIAEITPIGEKTPADFAIEMAQYMRSV